MAIKKSELYSSLWKSCDELRGGMDASQYKDYVLVLLFIKYISDRYAGVPYAPITVPKRASFKDMVALKGKATIGDDINKKIIGPIAQANQLSEMPDFNNPDKLGSGKAMVERLSNLIGIFENTALDFSKNRAEGDDILGDAYEYLMRHFATESGKSKGQFYTPAEVSRIMAKVIGVNAKTTLTTTVYDPTCGSGSLLLKVADESESGMSIYGQENDSATAGLARMNMVLHNNPTAVIERENTLATPKYLDANGHLKMFDFVVANPPFSYKSWSNGVDAPNDIYNRFRDYGIPPKKNGDYAFLLHIIRSLKSKGKGACILPHGVLFRGHSEADIRTNIIRRGYIKGIIGLPANLFYGTGIPACIIVLDKEKADNRKGIFIIDASKGFVKDGNKNRLREQDIHKIVDVFNKQTEIEKYSRMVSVTEIEDKHEFNLNIPRYIDSQEPEDLQDIEAHLLGDIPIVDIDALQDYWEVYPTLRKELFTAGRNKSYCRLKIEKDQIKTTIFSHPEFIAYSEEVNGVFAKWKTKNKPKLTGIAVDDKPKKLIHEISEDILKCFSGLSLINKYDIYQHLMTYWAETMQDDVYALVVDGWKAGNEIEKDDKKKSQWDGRIIPKQLMIARYFASEQKAIDTLETQRENIAHQQEEIAGEHSGEEGPLNKVSNKTDANNSLNEYIQLAWQEYFLETFNAYEEAINDLKKLVADLSEIKNDNRIESLKNNKGNVTQKAIKDRLKQVKDGNEINLLDGFISISQEITAKKKTTKELLESASCKIDEKAENEPDAEFLTDIKVIKRYIDLLDKETDIKKQIKTTQAELDSKLLAKYKELPETEIKILVVDDKWLTAIERDVKTEMDRISQRLARRIKELAERYETLLPQQHKEVNELTAKVDIHLKKMGFVWK